MRSDQDIFDLSMIEAGQIDLEVITIENMEGECEFKYFDEINSPRFQ